MKPLIPEISNEELRNRANKIEALIAKPDGLYQIEEPDSLRDIAFQYDPRHMEKVEEAMMTVWHIITWHKCGQDGSFRPTIADVLAQIPEYLLDSVSTFTVEQGLNDIIDANGTTMKDIAGFYDGYHVATTTLYRWL